MCGIAGVVTADPVQKPDRPRLERMIKALRHRGPDGFGFHVGPGVGLAHARLSIIDLVSGDQPIRNETGTIQVVFNGEIFNYIELRRRLEESGHRFYTQSDTEVIVHAYEQYGLEFVREVNGQFAIALWDSGTHQLVLVRDRVGIRPLVFAQTAAGLAFASESKALFAAGWIKPELDPLGLAEVNTFWGCVAPRSAFAGVKSLAPGHMAVFRNNRLEFRRYWDWNFNEAPAERIGTLEDCIDQIQSLFLDSVRLQLRADVPVGAYLSGGLDSAAVTAAIRRASIAQLKTFSVTFENPEYDEGSFQRKVAAHLATEHLTRKVRSREIGEAFPRAIWHIESPVVRTAGVPMMLLADRVRAEGFKVVLTGEGADEVFGGYDLFKEAKIRRFAARRAGSTWRLSLLRRLYGYLVNSPTAPAAMAAGFFANTAGALDDPYFAHRPRWNSTNRTLRLLSPEYRSRIEADHPISRLFDLAPKPDARWSALGRDQYVEAHTLLTGYLLHAQGDRVAMAASIEGRYPFLDHRLIEFVGGLPARWKIRGLREKQILRQAVDGWLPADISRRSKQPYRAPDSESFFVDGKPLDYVEDALQPSRIRDFGYFEPQMVTKLTEKCRAGKAIGFSDNMAFVSILSTQVLHQQFVAGTKS